GQEPDHPRLRIRQPGDRQSEEGRQRRVIETLDVVRREAGQQMGRGVVIVAKVGAEAVENAQRQPQAAIEEEAGQPGDEPVEGKPAARPWSHESSLPASRYTPTKTTMEGASYQPQQPEGGRREQCYHRLHGRPSEE